ncbi:carbohydrate esterase family 3 protein [Durotheca rogersii]|uniref:carbohydrate esterase family 3 protein n=1 Tax=Durotheca rogersii TaxID=419775 RepID=UPI0022202D55|nr:carbohydrate esterase family 3 protein [Durotheca rogersii]KAI5860443.1 carbohydrate esterase family 3 protein [Durotheca rogersii]
MHPSPPSPSMEADKNQSMAPTASRRSCPSFMRTKRAIFALSMLVIVSAVLIALGAANILHPRSDVSSDDGGGAGSDSSTNSTVPTDDPPTITITQNGITIPPGDWRPENSSRIADGTPLRIMALGASLVRGEFSTGDVGFRQTMREELTGTLGAVVNMVGSQRFGDMLDNDLEAYGGNRVTQIHEHARRIVPRLQPNLFLVHVGSNNVLQHRDVNRTGADLFAFVDYLLTASPRAAVVVSTCLTNTVPGCEPEILDVNRQYRALMRDRFAGRPVLLAEMHPSEGFPGRPQVADIGPDGTHPTDYGYALMGRIFVDAVRVADDLGYLRRPVPNGLADDGEAGRANETSATAELPPTATPTRVTRTTRATSTVATGTATSATASTSPRL